VFPVHDESDEQQGDNRHRNPHDSILNHHRAEIKGLRSPLDTLTQIWRFRIMN
jgi:hypothetical protein